MYRAREQCNTEKMDKGERRIKIKVQAHGGEEEENNSVSMLFGKQVIKCRLIDIFESIYDNY